MWNWVHSSSSLLLPFQDAISSAFDSAWRYASTFESYRQFYQENESLDLEAIRLEEHGNTNYYTCCAVFSKSNWLLNMEEMKFFYEVITFYVQLTTCVFC